MLNYKRVRPFDERILRKMHTLEMTNYLIVQSEQLSSDNIQNHEASFQHDAIMTLRNSSN